MYQPKENDLLRLKQAAAHLNMSRTSLWRLAEKDPSFPKKIKVSSRICYFRKSELDNWIATKELSH